MNMLRLASLSLLLLFGCEGSPVPLGPPESAPLDAALAGLWEPVDGHIDGERLLLRILPFNDHEYYVEVQSQEAPDASPEIVRLRGFITEVNDMRFANLQLIEEEDKTYLICKIDRSEDDILVVGCFSDDQVDAIMTSGDLAPTIDALIEQGVLDEDEARFQRKGD